MVMSLQLVHILLVDRSLTSLPLTGSRSGTSRYPDIDIADHISHCTHPHAYNLQCNAVQAHFSSVQVTKERGRMMRHLTHGVSACAGL